MDIPQGDDKVESNKVLEYYKKYAQNPELFKYFTGSEAEVVKVKPSKINFRREPEESYSKILEPGNLDLERETPVTPSLNQDDDIENKNVSPSSSIASNKKLEWDNGADIGYSNSYKISTRKSASFPSLFTNDISAKSTKPSNISAEKSLVENINELRKMYTQLTFSSEASSSPPKENIISSYSSSPPKEPTIPDSSSSQNDPSLKKYSSSSSSSGNNQLSYLQKRIGIPKANSTPNDEPSSKSSSEHEGYRETPMLRVQSKPKKKLNEETLKDDLSDESIQNNMLSKESEEFVQKLSKIQKEINLCLTKPIFMECISNKEMKNKVSQTSFSLDKVSKSIQTKVLKPHNKIIHPSSINICTPHTQKIECIQYKSCTKNSDSVSSKNTNSDNSKSTFSPEELVFSKLNSPVDLGKGSDVKNVKHGTNGKKYSDLESRYHIEDKNITGERNLLQESEKNCENKKTKVLKPQNEVIYPSSTKICTPQTQKIECIRYKNYTKNSDSFSSKCKNNNDNSKSTSSEELVFVKVVKNPAEYSSEKIVQNRCTEKKYSDLESKYRTENDDKVEEKNSMLHDNKEYYPQKLKKNGDIESDKEKERVSQSERSNASMSNSGNTTESSVLKNDRKYRSGLGKYSDSDKESGSKELLAEMISLNQSRDLNTDVKRSINILQKLLKSKKYDQSTKKYYIKKIVEKIVESRYSDDSTTSSELFRPKKNSVATLTIPEKLTENKIEMVQKESSLMDNIPWYPVAPPTIISPEKTKKTDYKVTRTEISTNRKIPEEKFKAIFRDDQELIKMQKLQQHQKKNLKSSNSAGQRPDKLSSSPENLGFIRDRNSVPQAKVDDKNWRSAKTLSERLLENRDKIGLGQGDYVLHVAANERQHQLSWINNEIDYLVKLKGMLEKKKTSSAVPKMKDVMSSLVKMKVDDMKGLTKNFDVFVCKCTEANGKCECASRKSSTDRKARKKSASLTPGYYTIETQLDPNGNLLDLTVYDEKGIKKYNYQSDGDVDDVMITSKNNNTAVKLKPKAEEYSGRLVSSPYKECKACGRLFLPSLNDPETCLCEECLQADPEPEFTSSSDRSKKVCKSCGRLFVPSKNRPDLCICEECLDEEPQQEQIDYNPYRICETCGRLFVPPEDAPEKCVCEKCCISKVKQKAKYSYQQRAVKKCRECGNTFIPSKENPQQNVCDGCLQQVLRCACQKVTFSEPLELGVCQCNAKNAQQRSSTPTKRPVTPKKFAATSSKKPTREEICPSCGRKLPQCICGDKFMPKKPKLVGNGTYKNLNDRRELKRSNSLDESCVPCRIYESLPKFNCACKIDRGRPGTDGIEEVCDCGRNTKPSPNRPPSRPSSMRKERRRSNVSFSDEDELERDKRIRRYPCSHCAGVQVNTFPLPRPSRSRSPSPRSQVPCPSIRKRGSAVRTDSINGSTEKITCVCNAGQKQRLNKLYQRSDTFVPCTNTPSGSSSELLKQSGKPRKISTSQAKTGKCCEACTSCTFPPSPRPSSAPRDRTRNNSSPLTSMKNSETRRNIHEKCPPECQAINRKRSSTAVQGKKSCSCCTCTHCAIQTKRLNDKNARCQCCICENCGIQVTLDRNGKPRKPIVAKWCQPKKSNTSLRSPKSTSRPSSSRTIPDNQSNHREGNNRKKDYADKSPELHKSLQICPSVLRGICRSVNAMSTTQNRPFSEQNPDRCPSCDSLDYPCKQLNPKEGPVEQSASDISFTCPAKKSSCPAKQAPCPGMNNKPCPAVTPRPCPNRKPPPCEDDPGQKNSKSQSKKTECPGKKNCPSKNLPPCPGRKPPTYNSNGNGKISPEIASICLPVTIISSSPHQEDRNSNKKSGSSSMSYREEISSHEEVPSLSSNSQPTPSPNGDAPFLGTGSKQLQVQLHLCTTQNPMKMSEQNSVYDRMQCCCSIETCKCNQTSTHEEKNVQCPAFKQCSCQTEPQEDATVQCSRKEEAGVSCNCDEDAMCQCQKTESSSSSSSSKSSSESFMSCVCCKKEKILKKLINKQPLCNPCQKVHQKCFYPYAYSNPLHSCMCYSLVDQGTLCQLKTTLTELERLDIYQQYCEILKNCKCCKKCGCKCKLPKKFKNGCAYFLKLEDACPNTRCEHEGEGCGCDEYNEDEEEQEVNYLPEVTVKVPNCRGPCAQNKKNNMKNETKNQMSCPSIQTYLCTMKPEFIEKAERRRKILRHATLEREEDMEKRKLRFIDRVNYHKQKLRNQVSSETNVYGPYGGVAKTYCTFDIELDDAPRRIGPRVFRSFKEMKDLTRRKYMHLSEVRSKKDIHREKRLREANRILANTFTKKLQRSTLRGTVDIPPNVRVVSY